MVSRRYDPDRIKIAIVNDEFKDFFEVMDENDPSYMRETDDVIEIIDNDDKNQMRSGTPISDKANHFMEKKELETIKLVAETREGIMILKDGPLRLPKAHRMSIIKDILEVAARHDNVVVGISKDSHEKNTSGVDDEIILNIISSSSSRSEITGYYPKHEGNDAFKIGECFARLHARAMKWFRVDYPFESPVGIGEILRTIACYSQVNTMPGTPFPLMDTAHEIAVKIRQLKPSIESKIMEYLKDEGFSGNDIIRGLTDVTGKLMTGSHHDFLDNFTRVSTAGDRR
jgi:hypothetical protein